VARYLPRRQADGAAALKALRREVFGEAWRAVVAHRKCRERTPWSFANTAASRVAQISGVWCISPLARVRRRSARPQAA